MVTPKEGEMKTEVTIESQYCCPCCGARSLVRDCQAVLFFSRRTWWCQVCQAEFNFEFIRHGVPPGGFRVMPAPPPDLEWHDDPVVAL